MTKRASRLPLLLWMGHSQAGGQRLWSATEKEALDDACQSTAPHYGQQLHSLQVWGVVREGKRRVGAGVAGKQAVSQTQRLPQPMMPCHVTRSATR